MEVAAASPAPKRYSRTRLKCVRYSTDNGPESSRNSSQPSASPLQAHDGDASMSAPASLPEESQLEGDTNCDVCGGGESTEGDSILYCDGCDVGVHQSCY